MSRKGRSSLAAERVNVLPGGRLEEIYEALRRFSSARINKLRLSKYENRVLAAPIAHGLAPRAVKYICWRRSMLSFAFVPFATSTCLKLSQLWNTTNWETFSRNLNAYLPFIGESHTNYFQTIFYMWVMQNVLYAISMLATVTLLLYGSMKWSRYPISRNSVRMGYMVSFIVPFLVLLSVPFRQTVDFNALKAQICRERLDLILNETHLNISSQEVCLLPPQRWVPTVQQELRNAGFAMNQTTNTCENALQLYETSSNSESIDKQPCRHSECSECFTTGSNECIAMAASIIYGGIQDHRCVKCYRSQPELNNLTCMDVCKDQYMPQAISQSGGHCVSDLMALQLEALTSFVSQVDYAQFFVGAFMGATALQTLFPSSFSLMFGSIRGARVAKSISPWSRLPGYGMAGSIVLGMPMLAAMIISLHQVVGDEWSLLGIIFLFSSVLIWYPFGSTEQIGLIEPQNYQVAINEMSIRNRYSLMCKLASLLSIVLFMAKSDIGQIVKTEVETYVLEHNSSLLSRLGETISSFFLDLLGKSLLSAVVFSDISIDIFTSVTAGDLQDDVMVQTNRNATCRALGTLELTQVPLQHVIYPATTSVDSIEMIMEK